MIGLVSMLLETMVQQVKERFFSYSWREVEEGKRKRNNNLVALATIRFITTNDK